MIFKTIAFGAGGVLLLWFAARKLTRIARPRVDVAPVSEQWLAEQRGAPTEY